MSDKEFCSDAHRESFADEELLAMRRLAEAQPVLQKTQRMPTFRPVAAPAPHVPATAAGGNMVIFGESLPFEPDAVAPVKRKAIQAADPLASPATVLFLDRDHRMSDRMQVGCAATPLPLPLVLAAVNRRVPALPPKARRFSSRIALPRGMDGALLHPCGWSVRPETRLNGVRRQLPAAGSRTPVYPAGHQQWVAAESLRLPAAATHGLPVQLRIVNQPVPVLSSAAGQAPAPVVRRCRPAGLTSGMRYPVAGLAAVAHPNVPELERNDGAELWAAVELAGLCPSVSAAGYFAISPAVPEWAAANATVGPDLAAPMPRFASVGLAVSGVQALPSSHTTVPLRDSSVLPEAPLPAPLPCAVRPYLEPQITELLPLLAAATRAGSLPAPETMPVFPPAPVVAPQRSATRADWIAHVPRAHAGAVSSRTRLRSNGALPSPAAVLAIDTPQPGTSDCRPAEPRTEWRSLRLPSVLPASVSAPRCGGLPAASRVGVPLRPDPAVAAYTAINTSALPLVLVPVIASRLSYLRAGEQRAQCVAVSAPGVAHLVARPAVVPAAAGCPEPIISPSGLRAIAAAPVQLPVRLFAVPNAAPMVRQTAGRPSVFPMGEWGGRPAICSAGLAADDGKPRSRAAAVRNFGRSLRDRLSLGGLRRTWSTGRNIPSDLKWIAMVIPLVLGIWILSRSSDPAPVPAAPISDMAAAAETPAAVEPGANRKSNRNSGRPGGGEAQAAIAAPSAAAATPESPAEGPAPGAWDVFRARLASRASVHFIEDFRSGLSQWEGRGEWARSWSYDRSGTVRPGQLALFLPTLGLRDYVMEINASVDRRSIQWAVRAADAQNYHMARLNVTPGASLTYLELERWSVIKGRMGRVTRLPLPHGAANQSLYAIRVEARGDSITTYLNEQVIDTYSDSRLPAGGVGLVATGEDRPRIYGLRISHQNDFLGKLCSFLAPPPIVPQGSD